MQDLILKGSGEVVIDIGGYRRKATIGKDGEAFFPEIPANFRGREVPVLLVAEGYELNNANQTIKLDSSSAYVQVRKKPGRIAGQLKDDAQTPLVGVSIVVGNLRTSSDSTGHFELTVPGDQLEPNLTLNAVAPGYVTWSDTVIPNSNDVTIILHRRH
jgi:hypothetical protein